MGKIIRLEKMQNLRDLGGERGYEGRRLREGKLFRAGRPGDGSEGDLKVLESLGTNLIIDLRSAEESTSKPDPPVPGATVKLITVSTDPVTGQAVHDRETVSVRERMSAMYRDIILGRASSEALGEVLRSILDNSEGVTLFHCTAGKDRTGIVSALVYELLGVPRERIIDDYMSTNECLRDFADALYARLISRMGREEITDEFTENFCDSMFVREEYILSMYDAIEEGFGGIEAYLESIFPGSRDAYRDAFLM